jgi:plastocyanin
MMSIRMTSRTMTMRRALGITAAAALAAASFAVPAGAGTVSGKVTFDGKAPTLKPLDMNADPACAAKHDSPVPPEMLVLGPGNSLANVFVSVKNAPAGDPPKGKVVIDQNGCMYQPHVVGVGVGAELVFKNSDGVLHNVHGLPKENREFNLGMPASLKEKAQVLNKPEPVFPVKCDVHPWMRAYVAVMTHPYFDVTGTDGKFSIANLPAGSYEIEVWHERLGTATKSVTVDASGTATADFALKVPAK